MFLLGFIVGLFVALVVFRRWLTREVEPPRRDRARIALGDGVESPKAGR